jgi:hypothetical protein
MDNKKNHLPGSLRGGDSVKTMNNHVAAYNPTGGKKTGAIGKKGEIGPTAYLQKAKATRMCS